MVGTTADVALQLSEGALAEARIFAAINAADDDADAAADALAGAEEQGAGKGCDHGNHGAIVVLGRMPATGTP